MRVIIRTSGFPEVYLKYKSLEEAAINSRPAMVEVGREMLRIIYLTYGSQGRRGGGGWKSDSPEWQARKADLGGDPRTGFFTGRLFESFSRPRAKNQIWEITPHDALVGSRLPYAEAQDEHRPYIKFSPADRLRLRQIIRDYFQLAWDVGDK